MKKVSNVINKLYGLLLMTSFFGGFLPLIPFVIALIIGGNTAEKICIFLYDEYYPWVIALASISVVLGLIGMYLSKQQGLSMKNLGEKKTKSE